jgi:hypothetical protein
MTNLTTAHPLDRLADWLAPAFFGGSAGWSAWIVGISPAAAAAVGLLAFGLAYVAIRRLGSARSTSTWAFEPAELNGLAVVDEELLLDDPLIEIEHGARVVSLFSGEAATPGELVTRIADYLGQGATPPAVEVHREPADASAALHAALANIRASLR